MYRKKHRKFIFGWIIILRDIIFLSIALNAFAFFHHVLPRSGGGPIETIVETTTMASPSAILPVASTPSGVSQSTPIPLPIGDFSDTFPTTDTGSNAYLSYQSDSIRIAINRIQENNATYYIADVYVKNISAFRTAFANGKYGRGYAQSVQQIAADNGAVIALSGDYYGAHSDGVVIRNGDLYREKPTADICVLYQDGIMESYYQDQFDWQTIKDRGGYQAWNFGPKLLENGQPLDHFNVDGNLRDRHPRSAIGYYAPGHYCLVVVDGRQAGYSVGMSLSELSIMFANLGCVDAYNFDGGQTAVMVFQGNIVNQPYKGGRDVSDVVFF